MTPTADPLPPLRLEEILRLSWSHLQELIRIDLDFDGAMGWNG